MSSRVPALNPLSTPSPQLHRTEASSSATLLGANGKLWQSHSLSKGPLLCKYSLKLSPFAIYTHRKPQFSWYIWMPHKKVLMGLSIFLNFFSYTAFPSPYSNCPLHSCKGSCSHLSPSESDHWRFSDRRRNFNSGTQSCCLGAARLVKFLHSWAHFPAGGTQALAELGSHSWHVAGRQECARNV